MPKSNYSDRRDANEPEIVKEFERLGFYVIRQPRTGGFDLLLIGYGKAHIVEIKSPGSEKNFTSNEISTCRKCNDSEVKYNVISSVEGARDFAEDAKRTI
jgi:hypothetical protein